MGVHFTPEIEKKLNDLTRQSGRAADDLMQDAVAGYESSFPAMRFSPG